MRSAKVFSVILTLFVSDVIGMMPMPFRIGFEFQMGGELCKWAMEDYTLQKSPIFEVGMRGEKLFHIELDGPDIEFVTIPFSHLSGEEVRLRECVGLITNTVELMMQLCVGADNSTTIGRWFDESSKISHIWMQKHDLFAKIAERPIKKPQLL